MEWFRKSFSKILCKYNRLSIFNVELFLVKLKLCSNNMSEQTFWKLPKFLVYWGKKESISFYQLYVIPGSQGPWCILNLEVRLCTNRYVFLCAMLASHLDPFIFNILLWKKKLSWPQVFVVHKLSKFPGRGGTPALWCDGNSSKILNISVVIKPSPPGDAVTSQEWR